MNAFCRALTSLTVAVAALFAGTGISHAGLDNELSLVDGKGRTLTIQQWDTFLNGVFPLDRNRLTREWFQSGKATYIEPGWADAVGNYGFTVYVEDRGAPGAAGDRFWLQVHDRNGNIVSISSMTAPTSGNAAALTGGSIVVPH